MLNVISNTGRTAMAKRVAIRNFIPTTGAFSHLMPVSEDCPCVTCQDNALLLEVSLAESELFEFSIAFEMEEEVFSPCSCDHDEEQESQFFQNHGCCQWCFLLSDEEDLPF